MKKTHIQKIEQIRDRKERVCQKVVNILTDICRDNKAILKKDPEYRIKDLESIKGKMRSKGCTDINMLEKYVDDIAGTRLTCCTRDEIPMVEKLIRRHPDIKKCTITRNWDDAPDEFGYRGHHLLVKVKFSYNNKAVIDTCEIQIRTLATDLWATLSHRDIYKAPIEASPMIRQDMVNLSQLLSTVDGMAVSLKERRREEIDKIIEEKREGKAEKDMLTPKNIGYLINKIYKKQIDIENAYSLIQYALSYNIPSLKDYKTLITRGSIYQKQIDEFFDRNGFEPRLSDRLHAPILIKSIGIKKAKNILMARIKKYRAEKEVKVGEKGSEISKDKLARTIKVSDLRQGKK